MGRGGGDRTGASRPMRSPCPQRSQKHCPGAACWPAPRAVVACACALPRASRARPSRPPPGVPAITHTLLIVLTRRATKGATGQPTGAYLPKRSHLHAAYTAAGFTVGFAP